MPANRCSQCGTNWPPVNKYRRCPVCQDITAYFPNADPLEEEDADREFKHANFRRFLEEETPAQRALRRKRFRERVHESQAQTAALLDDLTVVD